MRKILAFAILISLSSCYSQLPYNIRRYSEINTSIENKNITNSKLKFEKTRHALVNDVPIVTENALYFNDNNYVTSIDKNTGKTNWKYKTDGVLSIINGSDVVFVSTYSSVISLNKTSGKKNWKFSCSQISPSRLTASENNILFEGMDKYFYALDISTGKQVWRFKTKRILSIPKITNSDVIINDKHGIYSLALTNGTLNWKKNIKNNTGILASIYIDNNHIYYSGKNYENGDKVSDYAIYKLDIDSGEIHNTYHINEPIISINKVENNKITFWNYLNSELHYSSLNTKNNEVQSVSLLRMYFNRFVNSTVIKNTILISSDKGWLKAFNVSSGKLEWEIEPKDIDTISDYIVYQNKIYFISDKYILKIININNGDVLLSKQISEVDEYYVPKGLTLFSPSNIYQF